MPGERPSPTTPGRPAIELKPGNGVPVLLSVAHSGREYPAALIAHSRLGRASLERLEDPLVDILVQGAIDRGAGAVIARAPRAMIDLNRPLDELHPAAIRDRGGEPPTTRARAGLGLLPTRLSGLGDLWRAPIEESEFEQRVSEIYRPYHDALASRLAAMTTRWDEVVLLDCHSMPPRARGEANVVIGDRHGESAAAWLVEAAEAIVRRRGFAVARNAPFAGGEIVARHGAPRRGIHAIQIEVDRSAYCERDSRSPGPGFDRVAMLFEALSTELGAMLVHRHQVAAE